MVLGKFMPVHRGHCYLIDFARNFCDELFVVVGSLSSEPIPGELRVRWLRELYPQVRVLHLTDENPQLPEEHPDFWAIWKASLERVLPHSVDLVFASEEYGQPLAETLGAQFVPANGLRELIPVSGSQIRQDPFAHWDYLPPPVRPTFLKRVCLYGPESTGKSTLAQRLANHFHTLVVPEYARLYLERKNGPFELNDVPTIARGQWASEEALSRVANRVLISDTDVLTTAIWSDWMFQKIPPEVKELADRQSYDLYLLTDVDVPWVEDPVRYLPEQRESFFERCKRELQQRDIHYVPVRGGWEERFRTARLAVEKLMAQTRHSRESDR